LPRHGFSGRAPFFYVEQEPMSRKNGKKNGTTGPIVSDDGFELIGGGQGKEMAIGEVVTGVYAGIVRTMPGKKRGSVIPFYQVGDRALLGSTVLKNRIEEGVKLGKIREGKTLRVTRIEDAKAKRGQNPAKLYTVEVKRGA
jgi:hypothetical protein